MLQIRKLTSAFILAAVIIPLAGCGSTPDLSPDDASNQIAENLAAGKVEAAEEIFDGVDRSDEHRSAIRATVYERAGAYYRADRFREAIALLRFLNEHYPDQSAPRLALLYAHFHQRGKTNAVPGAKNLKEVNGLIETIREEDEKYPAWVDLAAAQAAVDGSRIETARKEYAQFKSKWDGRPREFAFYVEEFERYFRMLDGA